MSGCRVWLISFLALWRPSQDVSCNEIQALPAQVGRLQALRELNIRKNCLHMLPEGQSITPRCVCHHSACYECSVSDTLLTRLAGLPASLLPRITAVKCSVCFMLAVIISHLDYTEQIREKLSHNRVLRCDDELCLGVCVCTVSHCHFEHLFIYLNRLFQVFVYTCVNQVEHPSVF